ncbi:MAG TPA: glycosyltransferase family 87 protein [Thermoanaerobaculia bacterium]|nr:glycosyltransferase family 87 protein [Thermoanaerobaculia bacterium]
MARRLPVLSSPVILLVGILCRTLFLFAEPALSTDVYRYRWDGRVAVSGVNPYSSAPSDAPAASRPAWFNRINHPEIPTIYPPLAELLFFVWVRCWDGLALWRIILLLFDLGTAALIASTGQKRSALAYALCPFVIVEGFWSAHLEVAVTSALLFALTSLLRRREVRSAISLGIAIGLKITPLAVVAELVRASRKRGRFAMAVLASVFLPLAIFVGRPLMPGAGKFAARWSFNSPLFSALRWAMQREDVAGHLKQWFTLVKDPLRLEFAASLIYSHLYADFVTRLILGLLWIAGTAFLVLRGRPVRVAVAEAFTLLILLSPTIHPWYLLPLLPLALLAGRSDLVLLAGLSPVSYLLYQSPSFQPLVFLICYGVPVMAMVFRRDFMPD